MDPNDQSVSGAVSLDEPSLRASLAMRMDGVCNRFESAWQRGEAPRVESYLQEVPVADRSALVVELVALDCAYRRRRGETPSFNDYWCRFPKDIAVLAELFQISSARETPSAANVTVRGYRSPLAPRDDSIAVPKRIGRYELFELVGEGGFGRVFRAYDTQLQREVALKVAHSHVVFTTHDQQRFLREGRAAARLDHPHIAQVFDAGMTDGCHFIASRLVKGATLRDVLESGRQFTVREAVMLVRQLALALHHAHDLGVIHRDIKPDNILMHNDEPLIVDFGLARVADDSNPLATREGMQLGTPAYMSPEQAVGNSHLADARSDQWNLGVVLYELLAGRRPFAGAGFELLHAIRQKQPDSLHKVNNAIPKDLEAICLKSLEKRFQDRYPTCAQFADDLERWLTGQPFVMRNNRERHLRGRRGAVVAFASLVGLSALIIVVNRGDQVSTGRASRGIADMRLPRLPSAKEKDQASTLPEVQSTSSIVTSPLYDDFKDNVLDLNRWNVKGEVTEHESLKLWMCRDGVIYTAEASTANKPGGHDITGFRIGARRTGELCPQAECEVSLTNGKDAITIRWLNHSNEFAIESTEYYGLEKTIVRDPGAPGPADMPDGSFEIRQRGGNIEVLHDNFVEHTFRNRYVQPGSYFRASASGRSGLKHDYYSFDIGSVALFKHAVRP